MANNRKYKRIILKFSGEALSGARKFGIDYSVLRYIGNEIKPLLENKVEIGVVVGGGNLFRGASIKDLNRITADHMGMLATLSNALAMRDIFSESGISTHVMSALPVSGVVDSYDRLAALEKLNNGSVVIFAGGTGYPLVTTDTALSLRGIEMQADLLLKATNVDGVYSSDPSRDTEAKFLPFLTYEEALQNNLKVMDLVSFCLCREHNMVLRVYNMCKKGALKRIVLLGEDDGTLITNSCEK